MGEGKGLSIRGQLRGVVFWAVCTIVLAMRGFAGAQQPGPKETIPFAFAISGGVSLGSYESGLNWAIVRYLKLARQHERDTLTPEIRAVAGASAGSINSLMTAVSWCLDEERARMVEGFGTRDVYHDSVDRNVFRKIWVDIGIDQLLPEQVEAEGAYEQGDGLLTRKAFKGGLAELSEMLNADIFREDCDIRIGLMVTRTKPLPVSVAGIEVKNERFVIPLRMRADPAHPGKVRFESDLANGDNPLLGNVIFLQGTYTHEHAEKGVREVHVISTEAVTDAVQASSAFPVAFGKMTLRYCLPSAARGDGAGPGEVSECCPPGFTGAMSDFVDGGVFDNVPLGAVKALSEPNEFDADTEAAFAESGRRHIYLYLDPGNRRASGGAEPDREAYLAPHRSDTAAFGLSSQLGFITGAFSTATNYELYNVLRGGAWNHRSDVYVAQLLGRLSVVVDGFPGDRAPLSCSELFTDTKRPYSLPELKLAVDCIRERSEVLQREYTPGQRVSVPEREVFMLRKELMAWLERIADAVFPDDRQVVLSIREAGMDRLGDRRIVLTSRYSTLTGEFLYHFGAFLDRPFREFDYYAGVYDAVHGIAQYRCEGRESMPGCAGKEAAAVYKALGLSPDAPAGRVFAIIGRNEHACFASPDNEWNWIPHCRATGGNDGSPVSDPVSIVAKSLQKADVRREGETPSFRGFVRELAQSGYQAEGRFMQRMISMSDDAEFDWFHPLASRASLRLLKLEKEEAAKNGEPDFRLLLGLAAIGVHSVTPAEDPVAWTSSNFPASRSRAWNLMPYEISNDIKNGGFSLSWEPRWHVGNSFSLNARMIPLDRDSIRDDSIWFSEIALLPLYRKGLFAAGLGPAVNWTWNNTGRERRYNFGAAVVLEFFNKFRLTYGVRSITENEFTGENYYFSFGITDLQGIAYWLYKTYGSER